MVSESEVFDFWGIISNEIVGDVWLTIFLFTIAIIYMTIRFKMPFELQLIFIVMILTALFSQTLLIIIWTFTVLIVGSIAYYAASKLMT